MPELPGGPVTERPSVAIARSAVKGGRHGSLPRQQFRAHRAGRVSPVRAGALGARAVAPQSQRGAGAGKLLVTDDHELCARAGVGEQVLSLGAAVDRLGSLEPAQPRSPRRVEVPACCTHRGDDPIFSGLRVDDGPSFDGWPERGPPRTRRARCSGIRFQPVLDSGGAR